MTTVDDGPLEMDNALKLLDLSLEMGMDFPPVVDASMDHLVVLSKLLVISNNGFFDTIGHHLKLHTIHLVLGINLNDLRVKSPPLPLSIIHL